MQLPWRTYTPTNSTKIRYQGYRDRRKLLTTSQESGGRELELKLRGEECDARMGAIDGIAQLQCMRQLELGLEPRRQIVRRARRWMEIPRLARRYGRM